MVPIPGHFIPGFVTWVLPPLKTRLVLGDKDVEIVHGVRGVTASTPGSVANTKTRATTSTEVATKQALYPPPPSTTSHARGHPISEDYREGAIEAKQQLGETGKVPQRCQ